MSGSNQPNVPIPDAHAFLFQGFDRPTTDQPVGGQPVQGQAGSSEAAGRHVSQPGSGVQFRFRNELVSSQSLIPFVHMNRAIWFRKDSIRIAQSMDKNTGPELSALLLREIHKVDEAWKKHVANKKTDILDGGKETLPRAQTRLLQYAFTIRRELPLLIRLYEVHWQNLLTAIGCPDMIGGDQQPWDELPADTQRQQAELQSLNEG